MNKNQDNYTIGYHNIPNDGIGINQENLNLNVLVEKSLESELESKLQNSVVGGYSKKSVESFVAEMRNNLLRIKVQLERQVQDLSSEKSSVSQECSVLRSQLKAAEENLEEARSQIISQQYRDETQCASEQEIQLYREENDRLKGMLLDYQKVTEQKKKYESLLDQKEQEIAKLNETLDQYRKDYNDLKERTKQLEESLDRSPALVSSEKEIAELKQQKDKITEKYQALVQQMEETNCQLEQRKLHLDETETQLEQEKQYLEDVRKQLELEKQNLMEAQVRLETDIRKNRVLSQTETQLEQEKQHLEDVRVQLELEKQNLMEEQARLETDIQKNRALSQQLEDNRKLIHQKEEEINGLMLAKERTIDALQREQEEYKGKSGDLEKKIKALYLQYNQSEDKIKLQEKIISEKDLLLEYYQQQEKEYILIRQENEKSKIVITTLRKSLDQVMAHMDEQAEGINRYISHSLQERDALKIAVNERTDLQLKNIELMEQINSLSGRIEKLVSRNAKLKEDYEYHKNTVMNFDNVKKIIHLDENNAVQKTEDIEDPEESGIDTCRDAYLKAKTLISEMGGIDSEKEITELA